MKRVTQFFWNVPIRWYILLISIGLLYSTPLLAQDKITIKGKVSNQKSEAVIGAGVQVKGTTTGVVSDLDGNFTIDINDKNAILKVSALGHTTTEYPLAGQSEVAITLQTEIESLDQIVVVGFGTQKKGNLTGSVAIVDAKAIEDRPVQSAVQALQGMATGLNISQNNGSLEDKSSINIRGIGTIGDGSSSEPLILIDGMDGDLNAINPQDIQSVTVLKDAAAASIYGSRAAFGVILVTTKKGTGGKAKFNYNNSFRWTSPVLLPKTMDSYTFALYWNDGHTNSGKNPFFSPEHLQRIQDYQAGKISNSTIANPNNPNYWMDYDGANDNVNWYKTIYKNAFSQDHNVSLQGGTEQTNYYLSSSVLDQDGSMAFGGDEFQRYTATVKVGTKVADWVSANYSGRFIREAYERPAALGDGLYDYIGRQAWPTLPLYDPNGFLFSSPSPALALQDGGRDGSEKDWLYQQMQVTFEPLTDWKIFVEGNYRTYAEVRHWDNQVTYNHDVNGKPYAYNKSSGVHEENTKENFFNTNIYTNYSKTIAEKHHFKVMAGFQSEINKYRDMGATRQGIIVTSMPTLNTTSGTDFYGKTVSPSVNGAYKDWSTAGFFGRLNYDYDGRYLLEVNLRYDGSSRFRKDNRWNLFPSFSGGWNISKEKFWENYLPIVNQLKLRASYGELGNQNTKAWYPTYSTMPTGTSNGGWLVDGTRPNIASAPGLISATTTWERINTYDIGLDVSLLKNRLSISTDWFYRKTLDMIGPAPQLPNVLGTAVPKTNNTDLKTVGFELDIQWKDRLPNGLGYAAKVMLSDYQTEITRYPNETGTLSTYRKGQKMGDIWGFESISIAKTDAEMQAHLASLPNGGQDRLGSNWGAGDIMYKDLNGDGKIDWGADTEGDPGDKKKIGNNSPRFTFGIDLSADWKGFDFRAFFQGVMKRDYWQGSYFFWGITNNVWWSAGLTDHADYFRDDANHPLGANIDSYYPRPQFDRGGKNQHAQTKYLQNAAYIRLKNVQLGYTLPATLTQKFGCQKLRVFFSGENLWTGTNVAKMFDPETIDGKTNGSVYPLSKTYSMGLSINF